MSAFVFMQDFFNEQIMWLTRANNPPSPLCQVSQTQCILLSFTYLMQMCLNGEQLALLTQ